MIEVTFKVELKKGWNEEDLSFKSKKEALIMSKKACKDLKKVYNKDFCYASLFINKKDGSKSFLIDTF